MIHSTHFDYVGFQFMATVDERQFLQREIAQFTNWYHLKVFGYPRNRYFPIPNFLGVRNLYPFVMLHLVAYGCFCHVCLFKYDISVCVHTVFCDLWILYALCVQLRAFFLHAINAQHACTLICKSSVPSIFSSRTGWTTRKALWRMVGSPREAELSLRGANAPNLLGSAQTAWMAHVGTF